MDQNHKYPQKDKLCKIKIKTQNIQLVRSFKLTAVVRRFGEY